jgi:hypothetical protein
MVRRIESPCVQATRHGALMELPETSVNNARQPARSAGTSPRTDIGHPAEDHARLRDAVGAQGGLHGALEPPPRHGAELAGRHQQHGGPHAHHLHVDDGGVPGVRQSGWLLRRRGGPQRRESLGNGGHGASIKSHLHVDDGGVPGVGYVHPARRQQHGLWRVALVVRGGRGVGAEPAT